MSEKENFLFMASWYDILEGYDRAGKPEIASEIAKQIIYYGVTGKITSDDPVVVGTVTGMCAALIERSKSRYKNCTVNGKQGGRPPKYSTDEMVALRNRGLNPQQIADELGCALKTVQRALAAIDDEI